MMNYLKLTNFEFNRFAKILGVLIVIIFTIQIIGTIVESNNYLNHVELYMTQEGYSEQEIVQMLGPMSFKEIMRTQWFYGPIFIGIASVLFYIFLIWYRDWFGKNTFAYRLLMLPTERVNVYLAKLTTILIITLTYIAVQLIALLFELQLLKWIVPSELRVDLNLREVIMNSIDTGLLYPSTFFEFVLIYGAGITIVSVIFTAIIFERSYRLKGIFLGLLYGVLAVVVFMGPILIDDFILRGFFYSDEILWLTIVSGLIVLTMSIVLSGYLLRKKIRV